MRARDFLPRMLWWLAAIALPVSATEDQSLLSTPLSQAPGKQLEALRVTYAPGESSPPHRHGSDAYVYVLTGHIRSQVEGQPVRVYAPGQSWFEPAGIRHLVSANASDHEPASMLVVFVGAAQSAPRTQSK